MPVIYKTHKREYKRKRRDCGIIIFHLKGVLLNEIWIYITKKERSAGEWKRNESGIIKILSKVKSSLKVIAFLSHLMRFSSYYNLFSVLASGSPRSPWEELLNLYLYEKRISWKSYAGYYILTASQLQFCSKKRKEIFQP